jgi:gamma-glutamyl-gamma-aminobutyrate hydrolase PuuD
MTADPSPPRRPRILVTRAEEIPSERWEDYCDRLREAGADPVAADLAAWNPDAPAPTEPFDGLVLTGGIDIDPARYGARPHERVTTTNPTRDTFELQLLTEALDRDLPVLGICRGHQLFNVAGGGSLLQHLEEREPHRARRGADGVTVDSGWHDVEVAPGTRLARLLGVASVRTNSRHHQAVTPERVAEGLVVAATAPDGVVEALEDPSRRWALSVQWHPERPENAEHFRPVWADFVRACARPAVEASRSA